MRVSDVLYVIVLVFALLACLITLPAYTFLVGLALLAAAGILANRNY